MFKKRALKGNQESSGSKSYRIEEKSETFYLPKTKIKLCSAENIRYWSIHNKLWAPNFWWAWTPGRTYTIKVAVMSKTFPDVTEKAWTNTVTVKYEHLVTYWIQEQTHCYS